MFLLVVCACVCLCSVDDDDDTLETEMFKFSFFALCCVLTNLYWQEADKTRMKLIFQQNNLLEFRTFHYTDSSESSQHSCSMMYKLA